MAKSDQIVAGIDVGGERKGFHAVALLNGCFLDRKADTDAIAISDWCLSLKVKILAVDAPCGWSRKDRSRLAERELAGEGIYCYATPTHERSQSVKFYGWICNGEKLYKQLQKHYPLFVGEPAVGRICFETFPHAIVCALKGSVVPARPKGKVRRQALRDQGIDESELPNIDFVDAALCALAADYFSRGQFKTYGDKAEGYIVVPS